MKRRSFLASILALPIVAPVAARAIPKAPTLPNQAVPRLWFNRGELLLRWKSVEGATRYLVYFWRAQDGTGLGRIDTEQTHLSFSDGHYLYARLRRYGSIAATVVPDGPNGYQLPPMSSNVCCLDFETVRILY
jgi:hypothetical protein